MTSVELELRLVLAAGGALRAGRYVVVAALLLALRTAATDLLFHDFRMIEGDRARLELSLFFDNVAITGGLATVAVGLSLLARTGDRHLNAAAARVFDKLSPPPSLTAPVRASSSAIDIGPSSAPSSHQARRPSASERRS